MVPRKARRPGKPGFVSWFRNFAPFLLIPALVVGPYALIFGRLPPFLGGLLPDVSHGKGDAGYRPLLPPSVVTSKVSKEENLAAGIQEPAISTGDSVPLVGKREGGVLTEKCRIFTMWNYNPKPPLYAHKNVDSWAKHSQGSCEVVLINDTNVRRYIKDMPEEYFRLEYDAAKSDMIRYALIYHNGGLYMDADFLITRDFTDIVKGLHNYDLVTYENRGQSCRSGTFSSNFLAGRKGSVVHKAIWEAQKAAVTKHCQPKEMKLEKVCCLDDPKVKCHIPWTQLGEGISHKVLSNMRSQKIAMKVFCFREEESFVPDQLDELLGKHVPAKRAEDYWQNMKEPEVRPFGRLAYHLFSSMSSLSKMKNEDFLDSSTLIGRLYTIAFSDSGNKGPASAQFLDDEVGLPHISGRVQKLFRPTVSSDDCVDLEVDESSTESIIGEQNEKKFSTWAFFWCQNIAIAAIESGRPVTLLSLPNGDTETQWPAWLKRPEGAQIEHQRGSKKVEDTLKTLRRLADLGGPGENAAIFLRSEIGTHVWALLEGLLRDKKQLAASVDLLFVKVNLCQSLPKEGQLQAAALLKRVEILAALHKVFELVAHDPAEGDPLHDKSGWLCRGDSEAFTTALSFVNKARLRELHRTSGLLSDRVELALRPTLTSEDCEGYDDAASEGDGALHTWCNKVLKGVLGNGREVVALSYGIATWDSWAKRLANYYHLQTDLLDCFEKPGQPGSTPSLEGWEVPPRRHEVCLGPEKSHSHGRSFEHLADRLPSDSDGGALRTMVKIDIESAEWEALESMKDEDLAKVAMLDLQIYLCRDLPHDDRRTALDRRIRLLERLTELFHVVARAPAHTSAFRGVADNEICSDKFPQTVSATYVNKVSLQQEDE